MKIFSWNVNGIRAVVNKGEFQQFITQNNPDIICLQETKAEQGQAIIDLPDYHEIWNSSQTKKGYSGTAIFSRTEPLQVINDIPEAFVSAAGLEADGYGSANHEGRVIAAEYDQFWLVTAYTPNVKDDLTRLPLREAWDTAITAYCADLQKQKPVIYCGDMNVAHTELDLANPKTNVGKHGFTTQERAGFDNWLAAGFTDVFRRDHEGNGYYTWWSHFAKSRERNVGWRIDYFLVSNALAPHITAANIHPQQMGSDHCPVSIEVAV